MFESGYIPEEYRIMKKFEDRDKESGDMVSKYIDDGNTLVCDIQEIPVELHSAIAHKLIDSGQVSLFVENLDKFEGLDHKVIVQRLMDSGQGITVLENLDKFQGVNHTELARWLIEKGKGYLVVENIGKLEVSNHTEIVYSLILNGLSIKVVDNLEKFKGVNHTELALRLIDQKKSFIVARLLYKFKDLGLEIARKLLENNKGSTVAIYLRHFKILNSEIAHKLIEGGQGLAVARNLDRFDSIDSVDMEDMKKISIKSIDRDEITYLLDSWRFQSIINFIQVAGEEQFIRLFGEDIYGEFTKIIDDLMKSHNKVLLQQVLYICELLHVSIDNELESKLLPILNDAEIQEYRSLYKDIHVNDEIIEFYVNNYLLAEVDMLGGGMTNIASAGGVLQREDQEFSFRDKVRVLDTKRTIEDQVSQMFEWMRQYLFNAVTLELSSQYNSVRSSLDPDREVVCNINLEQTSTEEIRLYIHQAIARFHEDGWTAAYGGEKWAAIAETVYAMWQDDISFAQKTALIDHVIDLEHNNGMLFNKDPENLKFEEDRGKRILDKKRDNKGSVTELLDMLEEETTNQDLVSRLRERVKAVEHLKKAPTKALGSD
ncbi:MAG TPA: hypothetical protein VJH75_00975 [Patescibacteria group bacterium]|nr:hypothetical protein [Patescibacteria group bacterium]